MTDEMKTFSFSDFIFLSLFDSEAKRERKPKQKEREKHRIELITLMRFAHRQQSKDIELAKTYLKDIKDNKND